MVAAAAAGRLGDEIRRVVMVWILSFLAYLRGETPRRHSAAHGLDKA
jgi:hypothetical protein